MKRQITFQKKNSKILISCLLSDISTPPCKALIKRKISFTKSFTYLILLLILPTLNLAQTVQSIPADCQELFFSEILIDKAQNTSGNWEFNYSVEVYNPSSSSINLANYEINLENSTTGASATIPLGTSSINSGEVYVLSNSNCGVSLASLSDHLSPNLDFGSYFTMTLRNSGVVIDRVGESNASTSAFNVTQFLADPQTYLQNYNLNLDDINNVTLKRSFWIKKGNVNFDATHLVSLWQYSLNSISDIGVHSSECVFVPVANKIHYGFANLSDEDPLNDFIELCSDDDCYELDIKFSFFTAVSISDVGNTPTCAFSLKVFQESENDLLTYNYYNPVYIFGSNQTGNNMKFTNNPAVWFYRENPYTYFSTVSGSGSGATTVHNTFSQICITDINSIWNNQVANPSVLNSGVEVVLEKFSIGGTCPYNPQPGSAILPFKVCRNPLSLFDNEILNQIKLFNNNNTLNISNIKTLDNLTIFNMDGKVFHNSSPVNYKNGIDIDINNYPIGMYIIRFTNKNEVVTKKFIKI